MLDPERVHELVVLEFNKILEGPGISWNKNGMITAIHKAFAIAYTKLLKELNEQKNPSRI